MGDPGFEIEFRWKEEVVYWEGHRGCVFSAAWGIPPGVTYIPDASTWDRVVPEWLRGRYAEVSERLHWDQRHIVEEVHDDSATPRLLEEVAR